MFSPVVFFRMVVTVVRAHAVVISFSRFFAVFFHPFPFIIWAVFHYFIRDAHTLISNAHFFSMCANVFNRVVFFIFFYSRRYCWVLWVLNWHCLYSQSLENVNFLKMIWIISCDIAFISIFTENIIIYLPIFLYAFTDKNVI